MFVNHISMISPLYLAVGPQSPLERLFTFFLNMCPFDDTAGAVSGKSRIP